MNTEQQTLLVQLYDEQPVAVDSLGGTNELKHITLEYRKVFKVNVSEEYILTQLIGLRKSGVLGRKTDRGEKPKAKPTWPKAEGGKFRVKVEVQVDLTGACSIISDMIMLGELPPVTRQEVFDFLIAYPDSAVHAGYWEDNLNEKEIAIIRATAERLFPELTDEG